MVPLTHHDIFMLQLAVDRWLADTIKQLRGTEKRGDAKALADVQERADHLAEVQRKLIQMRG